MLIIIYFIYLLECWDGEPNNRPLMHEVAKRLKMIISQSNTTIYQKQNNDVSKQIPSENKTLYSSAETSSHGELSQMIENFHNMDTKKYRFCNLNK